MQTESSRFSLIEIGSLEPALDMPYGDYLTTWWDQAGERYEPPVSFDQLTRLLRVNAHHESAVYCKRNTVVQGYRPGRSRVLTRAEMKAVLKLNRKMNRMATTKNPPTSTWPLMLWIEVSI